MPPDQAIQGCAVLASILIQRQPESWQARFAPVLCWRAFGFIVYKLLKARQHSTNPSYAYRWLRELRLTIQDSRSRNFFLIK